MGRYDIAIGKEPDATEPPLPTMKVFEEDGKINFVDVNNVFVGYNISQGCCEHADWFIADKIIECLPEDLATMKCTNLDGYVFDKSFFREVTGSDFQDGKMVVFRLVNVFLGNRYLHLFNCHNGYYGHGFEMKVGDAVEREGVL